MATKVKTGVIDSGAITSALITDASITADDLHTTLDLTGKTVTVATASASDNDTSVASTAYVTTAIANLADSAPSTLNTLNELAAALGDDANFSTTVTNSIATKLPLAGGTMTGNIAHASDFTIDAGGDIILDADGGDVILRDGGTSFLTALHSSGDAVLTSNVNDKDIIFKGYDNGGLFTALTLDMSEAGAATFNSTLNSRAITITDGTTNGASTIGTASNELLLDTNADTGLTIRSGASNTGVVSFASPSDHNIGQVYYDHNTNSMVIRTNDAAGLTIDSSQNATFAGNINLTGGGTIEAPSVGGGETLTLKAAGGITTIIDSNGNSGDDQFFKVQKHTNTDLFTVKETGNVEIPNGSLKVINSGTDAYFFEGVRSGGNVTLRMYDNSNNLYIDSYTNMNFRANQNGGAGGTFTLTGGNVGIGAVPTLPLDVSAEIAASIGQTSTYNYANNRNWAMRTNNYGSSNWGGWSLEQSTSNGGTPSVARIGVHMNGNVGINMGGDASSGLTDKNPATALHVGGDVTVGSADSVGTGAASAIRFVNDNERSRITSNYASGGGGQMGFWTDSTGGTLLQRAYIKNDGSFNFNGPVKMHSNYWATNDVLRAYSISGPSSTSLTRTINVNSYWSFLAQGGAFMFMIHGWQSDAATGMVHWHNDGSGSQVITGVYLNEFHTASGLTVSVAKGTGNYDIDISLASTHSNTHGWYWKVWA